MGYNRRYRRRSTASQILGDTSYIANRLPWEWTALLGVALFVIFYWLVPAWLNHHLESLQGNTFFPLVESIFARREHWFQLLGIASWLACTFFAIRGYLFMDQLDRSGERGVSFFSRILARLFD